MSSSSTVHAKIVVPSTLSLLYSQLAVLEFVGNVGVVGRSGGVARGVRLVGGLVGVVTGTGFFVGGVVGVAVRVVGIVVGVIVVNSGFVGFVRSWFFGAGPFTLSFPVSRIDSVSEFLHFFESRRSAYMSHVVLDTFC